MEVTTKDIEAALPYLSQTGHYELQIAVLQAQVAELRVQLSQAHHALNVYETAVREGDRTDVRPAEGGTGASQPLGVGVGADGGSSAPHEHTGANAGEWGHTPSFLGVKV